MAAQPDSREDRALDRPSRLDRLVIEVDPPDPARAVTVRVRGELDLATAPALRQRLESLLGDGIEDLVLDLRDVPFCDVAGLNVLLQVQSQLSSGGGQLTVLRPCRSLRIITAALGLGPQLHLRREHHAAGPGERAGEDGAASA